MRKKVKKRPNKIFGDQYRMDLRRQGVHLFQWTENNGSVLQKRLEDFLGCNANDDEANIPCTCNFAEIFVFYILKHVAGCFYEYLNGGND